ncbi:hypothetical protein [Plantactinospora sp. GCM10030261]|uniref:hypothetical protein n=1 Tax=Plantactinospora sp. GCM10030261 TaxID=3273420 RepID=UPI003620B4A1
MAAAPPPHQTAVPQQAAHSGTVVGREAAIPAPPVPAPAQQQAAAPVATAQAAAQAVAARSTRAVSGATPLAQPRSATEAGQENRPPTPDPSAPEDAGAPGRLSRLHIQSHLVSVPALARFRTPASANGLILGVDQQKAAVAVPFFRYEPTRVAVIGGVWAGKLIAFRALALGARVAVITAEPFLWQGFGERATGRQDRVTIFAAEQHLAFNATAHQPVLVVHDLGVTGASAPQPLGAWQTHLTVLRRLDRRGLPTVQAADLAIMQRLDAAEASLAVSALRLTGPTNHYLQMMNEDMLATASGGTERYLWCAQTEAERQQIGTPRR